MLLPKKTTAFVLLSAFCLGLPGCSSQYQETAGFFGRMFSGDGFQLYRMNIIQGNVLNHKLVRKIELGMSKEQVAYLLGKPILPSMFHEERWDYVYYVDSLYGNKDKYYRLALFFDDEYVVRIKRASKN